MRRIAAALFAALWMCPTRAQQATPPRFAAVFGDHMVLQRDQPLRLWGQAGREQALTVRFGDHAVDCRADETGAWSVELPALPGSDVGRDLAVTAETTTVLRDVVVGDVWLCSGQSNMAMGLDACGDPTAIAAADNARIRFRPYFEHFAGSPQTDLRQPAAWRRIDPATAGACTAVGYWFAHAVQPVAGVPIGLLECTVGGTEIECWMPREAFADPANAPSLARLDAAIADWQRELAAALPDVEAWLQAARVAAAAGRELPPAPRLRGHPNEDRQQWVRTTSLWNGMVRPLTPFAIGGVLWYQGENNAHEQDSYASKLRALIDSWRCAWGRELPFYYVQLPGYGQPTEAAATADPGFAPCRMGQLLCARLPRVGMAVTIDCGDPDDIHPRDKRTVGERLARWALRDEYAQQLEPSGPLFVAASRVETGMRLRFDHVGQGLMVGRWDTDRRQVIPTPAATLRGFALAGADRRWHQAEAHIDGARVVVRAEAVPEPVAVRYAYAACPTGANLYNADGLPASPFRSDDW